MKNIKDITISIFAIIGFVAILSSFTNQTQQTHSAVPESHVWEIYGAQGNGAFVMNKVTGELKVMRVNSAGTKAFKLKIENR